MRLLTFTTVCSISKILCNNYSYVKGYSKYFLSACLPAVYLYTNMLGIQVMQILCLESHAGRCWMCISFCFIRFRSKANFSVLEMSIKKSSYWYMTAHVNFSNFLCLTSYLLKYILTRQLLTAKFLMFGNELHECQMNNRESQ